MPTGTTKRPRAGVKKLSAALALVALAGATTGSCKKNDEIRAEHDAGATPDAPPDASQLGCPTGLKGAALVRIEAGSNVYCMDEREVSWGEYTAFMNAKAGDTAGQPQYCDWNTSFEPEYYSSGGLGEPDPTHKCPIDAKPTSDEVAARCLDFCDALAYCEWAGKRLCGRIGGPDQWGRMDVSPNDGTKETIAELAKTTAMEFGHACTQAGKSTYSYGPGYESARCIDNAWVAQNGANALTITDTANRDCHGSEPPYDQIHDLSASVAEWQNLCWLNGDGATGTSCLFIGGSYVDYKAEKLACAGGVGFLTSKEKRPYLGFRCCADASSPSAH